MLRVISPYDGRTVGELPLRSAASIEAALAAARRALEQWRRVPLAERAEQVATGLEMFRRHREAVAREVCDQMGKPIREARAEVDTMLARADHLLGIAADALASDVLPGDGAIAREVLHEPLGVVFAIAAWNYPLLIPINTIVAALLAGNVVLLKHSPLTPLCGERFAAAFAGLELPGLVQHLVVDHPQAATILADPRVDHAVFTGSVRGGREVYQAVAGRAAHPIDLGLELGGKDAAYIAEDADLDVAVAGIVEGAMYNAGQSCCAVERAYVHRAVYGEVVQRAAAAVGDLRLGDPLDEHTTLGPVAREQTRALLDRQIAQAQAAGARLIAGGGRVADLPGQFYAATVIADVANHLELMQEESFGPVLPLCSVDSDEHALALMNDSRFGLTASIWTADQARCRRLAGELAVGTVFQNRCDYLDPGLPWSGARESGKGSSLGRYGFWHLTRRKSLHLRT